MNFMIWILAGGAVGWAAFALLHLNQGRGQLASMFIGAAGGLLGGKLIAPMFVVPPAAGDFSASAMLIAALAAAACLELSHLVQTRWGV